MTDLDPAWLRSFVAIARSGSVTRAAWQVHRTQSAVSTQLRLLESTVGVKLIARSTRALSLTSEGMAFLPYAERLLLMQQEAHAAVRPVLRQTPRRIGISEYFFPSRLGELLSVLREATGNADLELLLCPSADLQRLWGADEVDLAVVAALAPPEGSRLLRREPLDWVSAPGYALPAAGPVPLVLLGPACPVREIALQAMARMGRPHHLQVGCTGSQAAVAAIRAGWGVGCLNASAITGDLDVLGRTDARRWPSPGRLPLYLMARPEMQTLAATPRRPGA